MVKASSLYQLARAQFGFSFGTPVGIIADRVRDADRHADAELLEWYRDKLAERDATESRWLYNGDVNLEHGGTFIDLTEWDNGYCEFVKVTDLASACGFEGACLIEHGTVSGTDDAKRIRKAVGACGWFPRSARRGTGQPAAQVKSMIRHIIADALAGYGYCDYDETRQEVVQLLDDAPMTYDGWTADKRLHNCDLMGYVKAVHLRD